MVDNLITLYEHNETEFKTNGLGSLVDAASCSVHEERNGEFELTMEYPVTGRHFSDLIMRSIIFARPNPHDNAQPFRIYSISKPINGVITINARHISYDLDGYSLAPFDKSSLLDVFEEMNNQMKQPWNSDKPPFHFSTTKTGAASMFNLVAPCSMRAILGGSEGTILDRWPGEYEWDIWEVKYHQNRGADRGVTIEYGKNLTDLEQEESCDNCWTAVYPYYYTDPQTDDEGVTTGGLVELDEKIVKLSGTYNYSRTLILDLTSDFEEMPTQSQLRERAQQYIEDNEIGSPSVSLTVSFLPLSETTAYSKLKLLEEVKLCDTVHVYFPRLNVASTAMCISTTYNVLTNKYTEIELGDAKSDLASTLAGQGNDTEKRIQSALNSNNSFLEEAIKRQTKMITGNLGGYVVLHDTNGDGMPDELLIMDHENVEDAVNIWRANQAGVGHSSTGYNGDYTTGWTMDGHFNASLITVGELWANIIKVGILSDQKGYNYWNLETGEFHMAATAMVGDQTIPDIANAALNDAKQYTNDSVGNFIEDTYNPKVAELQRQIDGQIETYYYDHEPTLQNEPASLWTDDTEKARHEGDLFYWKTKGYAYRFFKDGATWKWQMVQDTDITQALEKAKDAKDTADNKRRVFVTQPVPPYDTGDLWVQGKDGDILRCQRNKTGGAFDQGDWILASKYTDDSALNTFLTGEYKTTIDQLKQQDDQKSETWYQKQDPSTAWKDTAAKNNHIGDMWYCSDLANTTYGYKYWIWNGTSWDEMKTEPPKDLFDRFDGKAKIFVNTPTTPYQVGDLWFQSETSDIMTCINGRDSGSYTPGDWVKRNKYTDDSTFNNFFNGEYKTNLTNIQGQMDKKAETWRQGVDPSAAWKTSQEMLNHVGDMWYCTDASDTTHYGKYWIYDNNYTWTEMIVNPPQAVFDSIDGKAQIFVGTSNPTVPYHEGDLWFINSESDIMTCVKTRTSGLYDASEWKKYNKYTDDSALNTFLTGDYKTTISNLTTQVDQKAETWFQNNDPSSAWGTPALKTNHIGDMWYCTSASDTTHYGKYWLWDGAKWTEMKTTPPQAVFDQIDGKAQIFINTPTVPYSEGDLWFQSDTSDIMTCIKSRTSGSFTANEWQKRNKYIDLNTVDVGGTNLLSGTKDFVKPSGSNYPNVRGTLSGTYLGFSILTYSTANTSDFYDIVIWGDLNLEKDTDYTLSFYVRGAKGSGAQTAQLSTFLYDNAVQSGYDMAGTTTTFSSGDLKYSGFSSSWSRYWVTYHTLPSLSGTKRLSIRCNANTTLYICGVKFEKGNRPTDWSPSAADTEAYTNNAINNQSQEFIFNKLTNNGAIQGLYMQNGKLYVNATYMVTGKLASRNGKVYFDLDGNELACNKLVSTLTDRYPQANLQFYSGDNSGGGYLTDLLLSLTGDPDARLRFTATSATPNSIRAESTGLEILAGPSHEYRVIIGASTYTIGNKRYVGLVGGGSSSHVAITEDGDIYIGPGGWGTVHMGGRMTFTVIDLSENTMKYTLGLDDSGELSIGWASSSERYKDILRPLTPEDVDDLYNITPVMAKYKDELLKDENERKGVFHPMFVAEDVDKYAPFIVDHNKDGSCESWNERIMIPCMFQMLKDQKKQIDILTERLDRLEGGV